MSTYLLDTNTVSYFLRDHSPALSSRLLNTAPEELAISVITAGELRFGVQRLGAGRRAAALGQRLEQILESFATLPLQPEADFDIPLYNADLEAQGTPIGGNDLWIAAHALAGNMTLITNNLREFQRVPGLRVEDWA